ncbi:ATP-binding protein [Streptomyces sp. NPDC090045]|uniref:ATP-binding protein n=1 Tax=Streptomyces sp. NPDC090045 TaxID=3365927 RepID=UPI00381EB172
MSLPLTRRIARAALLLAAGAAPVVGAAGAASAAGLESVPLGALTAQDAPGAATDATTGAATDAVGSTAETLPAPAADVAGKAGGLLGGLPTKELPVSQLPVSELPVGGAGAVLPAGLPGAPLGG